MFELGVLIFCSTDVYDRLSKSVRYQVTGGSLGPIDFEFLPLSLFTPTSLEFKLNEGLLVNPPGVAVQPIQVASLRRRRLLTDTGADSIASVALFTVVPGVATSSLAHWTLADVEMEETFVTFLDYGDGLAQPALRINGSFSLSSTPLARLGVSGSVQLIVEASPWFGDQFDGLTLPPAALQLNLFAAYSSPINIASGVVLNNVFILASSHPNPILQGASTDVTFCLGGVVDFAQDESPCQLSARVCYTEPSTSVAFHGDVSNWQNAFGIRGLLIDFLHVRGLVGSGEFDLDVQALWQLGSSSVEYSLQGSKVGSFLGVAVEVDQFTLADVGSVFQDVFGGQFVCCVAVA
jgi:hypothetical protein